MSLPLNVLELPSSGLPMTETPAVSLARTFARQAERLVTSSPEAPILNPLNQVLNRAGMRNITALSEVGQEPIISSLLGRQSIFRDIREILKLSIPHLDALNEAIGRGEPLSDVRKRFRPKEIPSTEIEPYETFSDGSYSRNWYVWSDIAETLILCWKPGQKTRIHDHGDHEGMDGIYRGQMLEERFRHDDEGWLHKTVTLHHEASDTVFIGAEIIHQAGNPKESPDALVSIHTYVDPLRRF